MLPTNKAEWDEVDEAMKRSWKGFMRYKKLKPGERAGFMRAIAKELDAHADELIITASKETNLDQARLRSELIRTRFQLESYAAACEDGSSLDIKIETGDPYRMPYKPDLRKMLVPLGPVVIFGASNFPFAYSTAGGDTACAFAAGCSVVVKAHPAHLLTSNLVADAIQRAVKKSDLPADVFIHLQGASFETGKALVQHPLTKAVGFTGSLNGGRALFDLAGKRPVPIPVFAEMGSVNPVFMLPGKLKQDMEAIVNMYLKSITASAGQFCTNPGILVGIRSEELDNFQQLLTNKMNGVSPAEMLHSGITTNFFQKRKEMLAQQGVTLLTNEGPSDKESLCLTTLATVSSETFLINPLLHQEVFGAFSLLVTCSDIDDMINVAQVMEGQLSATLMATKEEVRSHPQLVDSLAAFCGRFVLNGVPTGVEVSMAMHHGGPYPASTDSRFSAVGSDGIKRFARPVCFQNWDDELLPEELRDENVLRLKRIYHDKTEL